MLFEPQIEEYTGPDMSEAIGDEWKELEFDQGDDGLFVMTPDTA